MPQHGFCDIDRRLESIIGCMDLTYNLMRYLQLTKPKGAARALA